MKISTTTPLDIPVELIDLPRWLFTMSDADYQRASRGHRAMGLGPDGDSMVNVEVVGGHLLVQHYRTESSSPSEIVLYSPDTTIYLNKLIPAKIGVRWTVKVAETGPATSSFTCIVEPFMSPFLDRLGRMTGLRRALQAHVNEETVLFADDLAAKLADRLAAAA